MQLVTAPVYGHQRFPDGYRSYLVLEARGDEAEVIETCMCVAGTVPVAALRKGMEQKLQPRKLREDMIRRAALRRREGRSVSEAAFAEALKRLGAAEGRVEKALATATRPELVEMRRRHAENGRRNKEQAEALEGARQVNAALAAIRAEEAVEEAKRLNAARAAAPSAAGSKSELVAALLCRPQGASVAELCAATGWKTCGHGTFRKLRAKGVVLERAERTPNGPRYYAHRVAVAAASS
jgi:hypothetical protein